MENEDQEEEEMEVENTQIDTDAPDFRMYRVVEGGEGRASTLLKAQQSIRGGVAAAEDTFNLLMADVSGSMCTAFPLVINAWNDCVADKLNGSTKLFIFSNTIYFLRDTPCLEASDRVGGGTNITEALRRVSQEVAGCSQTFVRVFIITDGEHNSGSPTPEEQINKMTVPPGKTVNVYLLGISSYFPVNYSIDIRSRLHNGNANVPSLYWAQSNADISHQMAAIGHDVTTGNVRMRLNHQGYKVPGLDTMSSMYPGEWMYFSRPPEDLADLKVTVGEEVRVIPLDIREANVSILLDDVFPQWNSGLIQQHRKRLPVPDDTFRLMESLFRASLGKLEGGVTSTGGGGGGGSARGVRERLQRKSVRQSEMRFATLMNKSRSVISVEGKYLDELELADNILKSTVSDTKYDAKTLKLRGHFASDFEAHVDQFRTAYRRIEAAIKAVPPPEPEECCRVTLSSTLSDLQDHDFLLMLDEGKYDLLRSFTMTGIPALAPVRDASQINVWTLAITHVLVTPFTVLSQRAIEEKLAVDGTNAATLGLTDKDVVMMPGEDSTRFNIIIPIVPAAAAAVLKPVVRSNLYAMMATFCILKNPHIIDHSAHLAALACVWVKSVTAHPTHTRPHYITDRLAAIAATAHLYTDRKTVATYLRALHQAPQQALMTESKETFEGHRLKCEALTKPLFLLGISKDTVTPEHLRLLLRLLLAEFVGRCLYNYKTSDTNATPYTHFFAPELTDASTKEAWMARVTQPIMNKFRATYKDLLKEFFAPENALKTIKEFVGRKKEELDNQIFDAISIKVDMEKVRRLKSLASCGDVTFDTFRVWAQEMGMSEEEVTAAYHPSQVSMHVCEALQCRKSRDRFTRRHNTYDDCLQEVRKGVREENGKALLLTIMEKIGEVAMSEWRMEYLRVHEPVVKPLSVVEVVAEARQQGVEVTADTFHQVYRYNARCKLLRNACQIPACPHYLRPTNKFNQHLAVERVNGAFPHALHLVSKELCEGGVGKVVAELMSGTHSGTRGRMKQPISQPLVLQKLTPQIEDLMLIYQQSAATN